MTPTQIIIYSLTLLISIILIGLIIGLYNSLVHLKNNIKKSYANIDVILKQRSDELPNLIGIVKGYMKYEQETLHTITKARTAIMTVDEPGRKAAADNILTDALKSLFAVAENYPELKAHTTFLQLQKRISGLENEIADRKEFYNDSVNIYNIRIHQFPAILLAKILGYTKEESFKASQKDREYVKAHFQ
jgi:LemA protein